MIQDCTLTCKECETTIECGTIENAREMAQAHTVWTDHASFDIDATIEPIHISTIDTKITIDT
jgi:hypothetical protein